MYVLYVSTHGFANAWVVTLREHLNRLNFMERKREARSVTKFDIEAISVTHH